MNDKQKPKELPSSPPKPKPSAIRIIKESADQPKSKS
jgi:hypothetical protein